MKVCTKCGKRRRRSSFYTLTTGRPYSWCKVCCRKRKSASYEVRRRARLKFYYGLTEIEWKQMEDRQRGLCAICGQKPHRKFLDVDHDHKTGKARGLLCNHCNVGIGWLRNDYRIAAKAAEYLERVCPNIEST